MITQKNWVSGPAYSRSKGFQKLDDKTQKWFRAIWTLRDSIAEKRDVPSFRVLSNQRVIDLVHQNKERDQLISKLKHTPLASHVQSFSTFLQSAEEDPTPIVLPVVEKKKAIRPHVEPVLFALRSWRNEKVEKEGLDPVVVLSNGQLKEVARYIPTTLSELKKVPTLRKWQRKFYGAVLIDIVQKSLPKKYKKRTVT